MGLKQEPVTGRTPIENLAYNSPYSRISHKILVLNSFEIIWDMLDALLISALFAYLDPFTMVFDSVAGDGKDFHAALLILRIHPGRETQLGGTDRGEVTRMGAQNNPAVSQR